MRKQLLLLLAATSWVCLSLPPRQQLLPSYHLELKSSTCVPAECCMRSVTIEKWASPKT